MNYEQPVEGFATTRQQDGRAGMNRSIFIHAAIVIACACALLTVSIFEKLPTARTAHLSSKISTPSR